MIIPTVTYGCPCCDGRIDEDAPGVMFCLDCEWRSDEDGRPCPECDGCGEVRHPGWGSRSCPEPTITCPRCRGRCSE